MRSHISLNHALLALIVVAIWGTNFVVIKEALATLPPFLFAALRFVLVFLPAAFFLKRPNVPWQQLAAYGILIGVGQFGFVYLSINGFIAAGLASLVVQTQVFFTIGLAMFFSGERLKFFQIVALLLAVSGIVVIMAHTDGDTTPLGLFMILIAALSWAAGNIVNRHSAQTTQNLNMLAYVVWSAAYAVPPLVVLSLLFEGVPLISNAIAHMTLGTWGAVLWQSVANSLFGYAIWGWLLARYPTATIAPLSLLVPVFGMGAAFVYLGEPLPVWKLIAAALIMGGLALNLLWPKVVGILRIQRP